MNSGVELQIKNLSKSYADRKVIQDLSLEIKPGSFVSILGPSGCGKSTLLRLIAGLDKPTSGNLEGSDAKSPSVGFVFQDAELLPWRTVKENISLPFELSLKNKNLPQEEKNQRIKDVLQQVRLLHAENHLPEELSGGMKMRVSLARALITKPRLLLLDEPFSALDEETRYQMQDLLRQIWLQEKMTVLFVTHSLSEAVYLSERVIRWNAFSKIIMDHSIPLPVNRTPNLRTSSEFNETLRLLEAKSILPGAFE